MQSSFVLKKTNKKNPIQFATQLNVLQHAHSKSSPSDNLVNVRSQLSITQELPIRHLPHHRDNNFLPMEIGTR